MRARERCGVDGRRQATKGGGLTVAEGAGARLSTKTVAMDTVG